MDIKLFLDLECDAPMLQIFHDYPEKVRSTNGNYNLSDVYMQKNINITISHKTQHKVIQPVFRYEIWFKINLLKTFKICENGD